MWQLAPSLDLVDGKTAFDAAASGDAAAIEVVRKYIDYLADGVTNLANIFRPEAIIIGGGVSKQGDSLIIPLKHELEQRIYGIKGYAPVESMHSNMRNAIRNSNRGQQGATFESTLCNTIH
jgi:glucokinase